MAIRTKQPKPLKPLKSIRWLRQTTSSESEFAVRKIWTSKAGRFQIIEATYKHPYKYPRRYLALYASDGINFQMVSNGHRKRKWAKQACEHHNRKLYAAGQLRYQEALKRYEAAVERQAERDKAKLKEQRKAERLAAKSAGQTEQGVLPKAKAVRQPKADVPVKAASTRSKSGHSAKASKGSAKPSGAKRAKRGKTA